MATHSLQSESTPTVAVANPDLGPATEMTVVTARTASYSDALQSTHVPISTTVAETACAADGPTAVDTSVHPPTAADNESDSEVDDYDDVTIGADLLTLVLGVDVAEDVPYGEIDDLPDSTDGVTASALVRPFVDKKGDTLLLLGKEGSAAIAGVEAGSLFAAVVNLTNSILGAGMLGLPAAFAESGWAVGTVLLVLAAITTIIGAQLLLAAQNTVGILPSSFYIVARAVHPALSVIIDLTITLYSTTPTCPCPPACLFQESLNPFSVSSCSVRRKPGVALFLLNNNAHHHCPHHSPAVILEHH
jgi:hypothetical protein